MTEEKTEPFNDWIVCMQKIANNGKPYSKVQRSKMECEYNEMVYAPFGGALLRHFLFKWYPRLENARPGFEPYINQFIESTFSALLKRMWENVTYNRESKKPSDIPGLDFQKILKLLEKMRRSKPAEVTEQDYADDSCFNFDEEGKKEFIKEINESNLKSWNYLSSYCREFISHLQPLFFKIMPELLDMDSEWWLLYEFDLISAQDDFKFDADRISNVHDNGLEAKWLEEKYQVLHAKLQEISAAKI